MRKINTRNFRLATRSTPREVNRRIVLNLIREYQPISRAELARRMQVHRGTMTPLVRELVESGVVFEKGTAATARGRRPDAALRPHARATRRRRRHPPRALGDRARRRQRTRAGARERSTRRSLPTSSPTCSRPRSPACCASTRPTAWTDARDSASCSPAWWIGRRGGSSTRRGSAGATSTCAARWRSASACAATSRARRSPARSRGSGWSRMPRAR